MCARKKEQSGAVPGNHAALTNDNHRALWSGRFAEGPDEAAVAFETSIHVDERMALDDIHGSIAHATMLGEQGIIPKKDASAIVQGLLGIERDLTSGLLAIDYSAEDIHSFVEATLTDRIGEAGKKLHTGRSRNDQIALDERLYLRRVVPELQNKIITLIEVLAGMAREHTRTLLTGFTHMQHAQPGTLAQHLLAWAFMLQRDWSRFSDSLGRIARSPLGSGALQGSTLPLDRESVAKKLGFDGVTENSLDSVSDRDYCIEFAFDCSLLQSHLSRMCEEVVLWTTTEFQFLSLSERWSTGSSIMPQKKNPDFAELIRGRTGKVYGDVMNLLTMVKGLPLAYDRDLQEDKEPLFDALDCVNANLTVFTAMISSATWNTERMALSCTGGFANATDLAEYLVRKGLPFRTAHGVAAKAVRMAIDAGLSAIEDLSLEELAMCSPLIQEDLYGLLKSEACVYARNTTGGPAAASTKKQILSLERFCKKCRAKTEQLCR
ncbi:MAG: argininosuccinate lyase [Treponema sp.]|nr:argininosuccinate lyase [Treponema sp.]